MQPCNSGVNEAYVETAKVFLLTRLAGSYCLLLPLRLVLFPALGRRPQGRGSLCVEFALPLPR